MPSFGLLLTHAMVAMKHTECQKQTADGLDFLVGVRLWPLAYIRKRRENTNFDPNQRFANSWCVRFHRNFDAEWTMATAQPHRQVSIGDLGWSFSATLVVLFVLCMLAGLFLPLRLAHGWVSLLSDAPIHSSRVWVEGLIWSVVLGWLVAIIFGTSYNWLVARRIFKEIS